MFERRDVLQQRRSPSVDDQIQRFAAGAKVVLKSGRVLGENIPAWFGLSKQTNKCDHGQNGTGRNIYGIPRKKKQNAQFRKNRKAENDVTSAKFLWMLFRVQTCVPSTDLGGAAVRAAGRFWVRDPFGHFFVQFTPFTHFLPVPVHVRSPFQDRCVLH